MRVLMLRTVAKTEYREGDTVELDDTQAAAYLARGLVAVLEPEKPLPPKPSKTAKKKGKPDG